MVGRRTRRGKKINKERRRRFEGRRSQRNAERWKRANEARIEREMDHIREAEDKNMLMALEVYRRKTDSEHPEYDNSDNKSLIANMRKRGLARRFNVDLDAADEEILSRLETLESRLKKDPFNGVLPGVVKRDGEYSLLLTDDSTDEYVQIYEISLEEGLTKLVETNKSRPMKLESVRTSDIDFLRNNSEFYDNSIFVRSDGVPIDQNLETHKICKELYESARNGESILPHKDGVSGGTSGRGYSIGFISTRNKRDPIYRTDGQKHLEDMTPDEIIEGELLGDGDIAIAYVFEDHVIIEAKDLNKATYVVVKDSFDELKDLSRWEAMRLTREEGLITRIFHEDVNGENFNFEKWKEKIITYLE